MLDQKELDAIKSAYVRVGKNFPRSACQDNYLVLMEECQREGKRVTEAYAAEVFGRLMNEGRLKVSTTVEEIRQILNEPQNWKYANQTIALEKEILRRSENSDFKNIRDFIDYAVLHGQIPGKDSNESSIKFPINPVWLNIYQTLHKNHWDYNVICDASRFAMEKECQSQGRPFTLDNLEAAFQKLKDRVVPHSEEWHEAQVCAELRASLLAAYKQSFERRLVGQHWVKTNEKLLTHTPALYEKEKPRLKVLPAHHLPPKANPKTEATARAEAESEENKPRVELPREELSKIANQGRPIYSQFEKLPEQGY